MTELILKSKQLELEDLPFLEALGRVEDETIFLERSPKGYKRSIIFICNHHD